jgi:hypothetical protein
MPKSSYTLKELAIYKLCPKLYYHLYVNSESLAFSNLYQLRLYAENVLYIDLMNRFKKYNEKHDKVYSFYDVEVYYILKDLSEKSAKDILPLFSCLPDYETNQMQEKALKRAVSFIANSVIKYMGYRFYTVKQAQSTYYDCGKFKLELQMDTVLYDMESSETRVNQNDLCLDFLAFRTNNYNMKLTHYDEMIEMLDENPYYADRLFLVNRIMSKINVQFDSVRFAEDGKTRVRKLVTEINKKDFSCDNTKPSDYCKYCCLSDVCMGSKMITKEQNDEKE